METVGKWFIGPSIGSFSRGMEGIPMKRISNNTANDVVNASWFELNGSKMVPSESVQIRCLDDVKCSCKNLAISGLQYQYDGFYIANNFTIGGRNCFDYVYSTVTPRAKLSFYLSSLSILHRIDKDYHNFYKIRENDLGLR